MEPASKTKALLLVEDDPVYAQFILSVIEKSGLPLKLFHVANLEQGLAYVQGDEPYADRAAYPMPAIVLLDIILGTDSGFPLLRWLREHGHLAHEQIRVVMLTASSGTENVQEALRLGALSYVVKSPSAENVLNLLAKLLLDPPKLPPPASGPGNQSARPQL